MKGKREMENVENNEMFLTTVDNPFNPFTQFDEWYLYDVEKGYNTCNYIDRVLSALTEMNKHSLPKLKQTNEAIKEIVSLNPLTYKIIYNN